MTDSINHASAGPCEAANCVQPASAAERMRDVLRQNSNFNFGGMGAGSPNFGSLGSPGSTRTNASGFDRG